MKKLVEGMDFYNPIYREIFKIIGKSRLKKLIKIPGIDEFRASAVLTHEGRFQVMTELFNGSSQEECVAKTGVEAGTVSKYGKEFKAYQSS
jgi:hypothetical protein